MGIENSTILVVPPMYLEEVRSEVLYNCLVVVRPFAKRSDTNHESVIRMRRQITRMTRLTISGLSSRDLSLP